MRRTVYNMGKQFMSKVSYEVAGKRRRRLCEWRPRTVEILERG